MTHELKHDLPYMDVGELVAGAFSCRGKSYVITTHGQIFRCDPAGGKLRMTRMELEIVSQGSS